MAARIDTISPYLSRAVKAAGPTRAKQSRAAIVCMTIGLPVASWSAGRVCRANMEMDPKRRRCAHNGSDSIEPIHPQFAVRRDAGSFATRAPVCAYLITTVYLHSERRR